MRFAVTFLHQSIAKKHGRSNKWFVKDGQTLKTASRNPEALLRLDAAVPRSLSPHLKVGARRSEPQQRLNSQAGSNSVRIH
jgi:hypothetical protein